MKKIFLLLFIFVSVSVFASKPNIGNSIFRNVSDTTVIPQLLSLPLVNYIGKPVDSLLSVLPTGYDGQGLIPARLGYIKGLYRVYGSQEFNYCSVQIFIDTIQFLPVPNYNQKNTWDMSLAGREIISFIKIVKNDTTCIYGCNNPKYY